MLKRVLCLALLGGTLSSAHWLKPARVPAQTNGDGTLVVAVFRTDGVIVPFARYANKRWTNPWQKSADAQPEEPNTIADLPKPWYELFLKTPAEWQLTLRSSEVLAVRTSKNVQAGSHCQKVWGLLSDYPKAKPEEKNVYLGPSGIGLSKKMKAPAMERLTEGSSDWQQVLKFLRPEFERAEAAGLTQANQFFYNQIPVADERAKIPPSMQNLYKHQLDDEGRILSYFEVKREYAKPPDVHDPSCNNISILEGWAVSDPYGNLALLESHFSPTDCDRKGSGRTVPFALLQLDGKTFAVVEETGYEGESYVILEIRKDSVHRVLETYAGSC